jgi:hypothetical protein
MLDWDTFFLLPRLYPCKTHFACLIICSGFLYWRALHHLNQARFQKGSVYGREKTIASRESMIMAGYCVYCIRLRLRLIVWEVLTSDRIGQ